MLLLIPMNSDEIDEATITSLKDVKVWTQLNIEDGKVIEILHNDKFDGFEHLSEAIVIRSDGESVMDFMGMGMMILVAHTQKYIDDIVEAYLFRELHDLAY